MKIEIIIGNYIRIYSHLHRNFIPTLFLGNFRNILYPGIKFSKLVTSIGICISIILFSGINKYNLKQTHRKELNMDENCQTILLKKMVNDK